MRITVNKDIGIPIYIQIFEQVKQQILSGELLPGFRLPSERKLSESLGVNRSTVLNAYRELKAEGLSVLRLEMVPLYLLLLMKK